MNLTGRDRDFQGQAGGCRHPSPARVSAISLNCSLPKSQGHEISRQPATRGGVAQQGAPDALVLVLQSLLSG